MQIDGFDITAPAFSAEAWSETEALGAAVWLWLHSAAHCEAPLHALNALLLPALKHRQFILGRHQGRPVFYASWSTLSAEAEQRYLDNPPVCMPEADWCSGERLWFHDWVAPFGHSAQLSRLLQRRFFAHRCARALYHRGGERGFQIRQFQGAGVMPAEAHAWFAAHPLAWGK